MRTEFRVFKNPFIVKVVFGVRELHLQKYNT